MTSNGAGPLLRVTEEISATRACQLRGNTFLAKEKTQPELILTQIQKDDAALFRGLNFTGNVKTLTVRVQGGAAQDQIEVNEEDASGALLGSITLTGASTPDQWRTEAGPLAVPARVKNICFVFKVQTAAPLALATFQWK